MIYKIVWTGLGLLLAAGVIYLGVVGISVSKVAIQVEVPLQKFLKK